MRTRRSLAALTTSLALAAWAVAAVGPVAASGSAAADRARAEHDRIVAHWTPERMKAAIPRDFRFDAASHTFSPARKPGTGGGGTVTGASWTKGGTVVTATGKVYFELDSGAYICSGTAVTDTKLDRSIVLSAGHCAYDGADGGFARNWMFIPDFDAAPTYTCANTKYGCWTASALVVNDGFASAGGFNTQATTYDWSFAVVGAGGLSGTQLDSTVGTFGTSFASFATGTTVDAFGYPAAGKYHGSDLTYCQAPSFLDTNNQSLTYGISCDMTGGSSGGPWFTGFDTAHGNSGTIQSLNSYGYSGVKNMYGPKFNASTQATFNAALTATANTIVP